VSRVLAAKRCATKSRTCMVARKREDVVGVIIDGAGGGDDGIAASHSQASTHRSVFEGRCTKVGTKAKLRMRWDRCRARQGQG